MHIEVYKYIDNLLEYNALGTIYHYKIVWFPLKRFISKVLPLIKCCFCGTNQNLPVRNDLETYTETQILEPTLKDAGKFNLLNFNFSFDLVCSYEVQKSRVILSDFFDRLNLNYENFTCVAVSCSTDYLKIKSRFISRSTKPIMIRY